MWTSVHYTRDWHLLSSNPFSSLTALQAASRDAGLCHEQELSCSPPRLLPPCSLYQSVTPLLCFPRVLKGRLHYTYSTYKKHSNKSWTRPFLFSLCVFLATLLLSAHLSCENKPPLSSLCLVSVLEPYLCLYTVLSCMAAWLQLKVSLRCSDNVRQRVCRR